VTTRDGIQVMVADDHPAFRAGVRALLELAEDISDRRGRQQRRRDRGGGRPPTGCRHDGPANAHSRWRRSHKGDSERKPQSCGSRTHNGRGQRIDFCCAPRRGTRIRAQRVGRDGAPPGRLRRREWRFISSPAVGKQMSQFFTADNADSRNQALSALSHREREVLDLMAGKITPLLPTSLCSGQRSSGIISPKLHVADRAEAIVRAREAGLGVRRGQ
jgi:hypothetical protein